MNSGRVALITGGSRGIGRACAIALAQDGFDIAFSFITNKAAANETATIVRDAGVRCSAYQTDLAQRGAAQSLVANVAGDFKRLDVLINNAAVAPVTPIDQITEEEWDRVLALNARAAFFAAQQALTIMRQQKAGRLIFMSSQAGQAGGVFIGAHYVASKAALIGLTKSFAKAGAAHNVLVNCVAPGQIDTPLTAGFPADKVAEMTSAIPVGRMGTADEVASVVRFLASDRASYVTGATIPVNGGFLMA